MIGELRETDRPKSRQSTILDGEHDMKRLDSELRPDSKRCSRPEPEREMGHDAPREPLREKLGEMPGEKLINWFRDRGIDALRY